jgi:DNA modification methylase
LSPVTYLYGHDARSIPLPDKSVHMVATSPPYFGLRAYGDSEHEIGREQLHDCLGWAQGANCGECYVCTLRGVARELWRVLRDDGTFWLNLGDSYCSTDKWGGGGDNTGKHSISDAGYVPSWAVRERRPDTAGLKAKDLIGIPWRVALALQADGWYLRSDIVWHKPNPMPSSVRDRCTPAHEYVFLFSKSRKYFYDADAVREPHTSSYSRDAISKAGCAGGDRPEGDNFNKEARHADGSTTPSTRAERARLLNPEGRNKRDVWTINTKPYAKAHFAVWPPKLVEPMILAGTSAKGVCSACGAPWTRQTKTTKVPDRPGRNQGRDSDSIDDAHGTDGRSGGWEPGCTCNAIITPATVLDPFGGSGTTAAVAYAHGRRAVLVDCHGEYEAMARERVEATTPPVLDGLSAKDLKALHAQLLAELPDDRRLEYAMRSALPERRPLKADNFEDCVLLLRLLDRWWPATTGELRT